MRRDLRRLIGRCVRDERGTALKNVIGKEF